MICGVLTGVIVNVAVVLGDDILYYSVYRTHFENYCEYTGQPVRRSGEVRGVFFGAGH